MRGKPARLDEIWHYFADIQPRQDFLYEQAQMGQPGQGS